MSNKQKCDACGKSCSRRLNICPTCSPATKPMPHTPELLAALECALNQLDALERAYEVNSDGRLSGSGLPPPSQTEAYQRARAAIAKATA